MNDFYKKILRKEFIRRFNQEELKKECLEKGYDQELIKTEYELEFMFLGCDDNTFENFLLQPGIYTKFCRFKYLLKKYSLHEFYLDYNYHGENITNNLRSFIWSVPNQDQFGDLSEISEPWIIDNGDVVCGCCDNDNLSPWDFDVYIRDYILDCYRLYYRSSYVEGLGLSQINDVFEFIHHNSGSPVFEFKELQRDDDELYFVYVNKKGAENCLMNYAAERINLLLY